MNERIRKIIKRPIIGLKVCLFTIAVGVSLSSCFAQNDLFTLVEEMPYFGECQTGEQDCFKKNFFPFVESHLIYPFERPKGLEKIRTYMKFVVQANGTIRDVSVAKTSGYDAYDAAAIKVINKLPEFVPGKQKGKAVDVQYLVPIDFLFEENTFPIKEENPHVANNEGEIFSIVEKMPLYGNCKEQVNDERIVSYYKESSKCSIKNIENYISKEVSKIRNKYPAGYFNPKIQFIIERDGRLTNATVKISSGNESIDQAALDIVSKMDEWQGGTQRGVPVRVQYLLPVQFK